MSASPRRRELLLDVGLLLLAPIAIVLLFAALGASGGAFALRVEHSGEDYNWLRILGAQGAAQKAHAFWTLDWRNPLSPWWYIFSERIYLTTPGGPLALRLVASPLLGLSAYFALQASSGWRCRGLALGIGIVAAGWTFGYSTDHVVWNILGACALSLLCVGSYATSFQNGRRSVGWYGLALTLWIAAFATYAFQTGAILAVALLAWLHATPTASLGRRIAAAVAEVAPFGLVAVLFLLVWITTRHPSLGEATALVPARLLGTMPASLRHGLWPGEYTSFAVLAWTRLGSGLAALMAVTGLAVALLVGRAASGARATTACDALMVLAIGICLVLPTLIIESTSLTWTAGTRWRMVHQFWLPLFWLTSLALLLAALPLGDKVRRWGLAGGTGMAAAVTLSASLGHNSLQVTLSEAQRSLRNGLGPIMAASADPVSLLILVEGDVPWLTAESLPDVVPAVWFRGRDVGMRVLRRGPPYTPHYGVWRGVHLTDDAVLNIRNGGGAASYAATRILRFDGHSVVLPKVITEAGVAGYPIEWRRAAPLTQP